MAARNDGWRGVAAEELDDLPPEVSARYRRRSRRLLGSLLKHRGDPGARRELEEVLKKAIELQNRLVAEEAREVLAQL